MIKTFSLSEMRKKERRVQRGPGMPVVQDYKETDSSQLHCKKKEG